jgi:hypothetical protein
MEQLWVENSAHGRFWRRLLRERAAQIAGDELHLRRLRYLPDLVKSLQKKFGHIWADANTNLYKLIAGAFGEVWDDEDDEKQRFAAAYAGKKEAAVKQRKLDDDLVRARQKDARRGVDELQGESQESLEDMEETGKWRRQEEEGEEEEGEEGGGRSRREEFYRRAGSC